MAQKYKYEYCCPICGTCLELKMRVTQTKRRCPQCGTPITPEEIDRQAVAAQQRLEAEVRRILAKRRREKAFGCLGCLGLIIVVLVVFGSINEGVPPGQEKTKVEEKPDNQEGRVPDHADAVPPANGKDEPKRDPPKPAKQADGVLMLETKRPVLKGVAAWVEIDGQRKADWKVGTTELRLFLPAGRYRVTVYSIYRRVKRTIYDQQVTVIGNETATVNVEE